MAKASDLIGQRFGRLSVVERAENNHKGNTMWKCQCDCGNTKVALGYDLTHGRTISCGCRLVGSISEQRQDLTNRKFGRLTVLKLNQEKSKNGKLYWDCICECGETTCVSASNLRAGKVKSCGCYRKDFIKKQSYKKPIEDKIGKRYNGFVVIDRVGFKDGKYIWKCRCDCGREFEKDNRRLYCTKSCGCLNKGAVVNPTSDLYFFTTEMGLSNKTYHRLHLEWRSMYNRCKEHYHGADIYFNRGIKVCDEWLKFKPFGIWAIKNGYNDELTLDRIDNSMGYSPDNCRWATWKTQQNNKRNNACVTYHGTTQTLKQWSEQLNLDYGMLKIRYQRGWQPPKLFEEKHKNQYC